MKNKIWGIWLIAVMVTFCCGCTSEITEEQSLAMEEERLPTEEIGLATEVNKSGSDEVISETDVPEVTMPEAVVPETSAPETGASDGTTADWGEVYYERYYETWDSEEAMLAEIKARASYRDSCSFFRDAVYYIEGGGGEYMMKTDISYLVEPLYPTDFVYIEEDDFKDYPPLLLHILKNEIYARHGYIFRNEDLNNYFRGMIWYTPQYESAEFDASVFNEIEVYNLDILARLDTYDQN